MVRLEPLGCGSYGCKRNPYVVGIGSAYEEGSAAPTGVNFDPTEATTIVRSSATLEMSNTAQQTNLRTTEQVKESQAEVLQLHGIDMERAFWWVLVIRLHEEWQTHSFHRANFLHWCEQHRKPKWQ